MTLRAVTGPFASAIGGPHLRMVLLVELGFSSGVLRLNNSPINLPWGGFTWYGAGRIGEISEIKETLTREVPGMAFTLNGVAAEFQAIALGEFVRGKTARIYVAMLDDAYQVVQDPVEEWTGLIDTMPMVHELADKKVSVTVTAENIMADFDRPLGRRFSDQDQKRDYPDDQFFEFVEALADKQIVWPSKDFFRR